MQPKAKNDRESIKGAILGSVIGDALGVPGEFMSREELKNSPIRAMIGGGAHGQPPGTWSDDTSMTLCTIDSICGGGINLDDQMNRFADWLWNASNTAHDEVFDVGGATKQSIFRFIKNTPAADCGERSEYSCGNGSLMRIAPTAIFLSFQNGGVEPVNSFYDIIHRTSACTHAHPRCMMACGIFGSVIFHMKHGKDLRGSVARGICSALSHYNADPQFEPVYREFSGLSAIAERNVSDVHSSGFVLHTLEAALWCLLTTDSYSDCVLKAVNLGEDTDTTGAVAGALAGFWYGEKAIPKTWADTTAKFSEITKRANGFCDVCLKNI